MITFIRTLGDEAELHVVCGNVSKAVSAVNGKDIINIDNVLNDIIENKNIKHVNLVVTHTDDERNVHEYLKSIETVTSDKKKMCRSDGKCVDEDCDEEDNPDFEEMDYTCPECGEKDVALYDKFGNKYPCLSCIKIDIGKQLLKKQKLEEEKQKSELEEYNKKLDDAFKDT